MLINGEEKPLTSIKDLVGFVPQEDIVHETLTVRARTFSSSSDAPMHLFSTEKGIDWVVDTGHQQ